jgi:NDP-sugar pyrophosphorylase family protein
MFPIVLLAGGLATRMRPITETVPKAMINVCGKPFIHYQLALLRKRGISHVVFCIGYLGEQIVNYVKDGRDFHMTVDYSWDGDTPLGTGGAIKNIGDRLSEYFFVLYGDSYLDIDYQDVGNIFFMSHKKALMTVFKNENKWDFSNVLFRNHELLKYSKKDKTREMNYIDYGLGILSKSIFDEFPANIPFDLAEVYEKLSDEKQLYGYEVFDRFYEIGSLNGLKKFCKKIRKDNE